MSLVDLSKIWAPIFVRPKAVNNLKNDLHSPLINFFHDVKSKIEQISNGCKKKSFIEASKERKDRTIKKSYALNQCCR